jgi:hypothetical protein
MAPKTRSSKRGQAASAQERSEDGVDLTLIRWILSPTPAERLRAGREFANSITRLRARQAKA